MAVGSTFLRKGLQRSSLTAKKISPSPVNLPQKCFVCLCFHKTVMMNATASGLPAQGEGEILEQCCLTQTWKARVGVNTGLFLPESPPSFWMYSTDKFTGRFRMGSVSPCLAEGRRQRGLLAFIFRSHRSIWLVFSCSSASRAGCCRRGVYTQGNRNYFICLSHSSLALCHPPLLRGGETSHPLLASQQGMEMPQGGKPLPAITLRSSFPN